jgi:CheY-like chemotaxis protein
VTKVLIVEDNSAIVKVMTIVLEREGYEVRSSDDDSCFKIADEWDPTVILMDVSLPMLDGFQACLQMKLNPVTAHIPVILVTADSDIDAIAEEVCADDVLAKPFSNKSLVEMVRTHSIYREYGSSPAP